MNVPATAAEPTGAAVLQTYAPYVARMAKALASGDADALLVAADALALERAGLFSIELDRVSRQLQTALDRFASSSRLEDLATNEVPNARRRLDHVLALTDEAAHRTLGLVEQSVPLASEMQRESRWLETLWVECRQRDLSAEDYAAVADGITRFLQSAQLNSGQLKENLGEVLLAQGYQDLSGQIIRGVITLVGELETILTGMVELIDRIPAGDKRGAARTPPAAASNGHGPVVPGVEHGVCVDGQGDVDSLLSELGL